MIIKKEYSKLITEVEEITSKDMLQEWDDKEFKQVEKEIKRLFSMKQLTDHRGNKRIMYTYKYNNSENNIEGFFGLPYTSSGSFAGLWNTNTRYCLDTEEKYNIDGFGLGKDGKVYIFCTNDEENEKVYKIN
jgi:hypothetical protein